MTYRIVQKCSWKEPINQEYQPIFPDEHNKIIRTFPTWWQARFWKFFEYDLRADRAWKTSFEWVIEKSG